VVAQHPASAPPKAVSVDGKVVALWHPLTTEGMEFWFVRDGWDAGGWKAVESWGGGRWVDWKDGAWGVEVNR
jgi:hypothetical protein